MRRRNSSRSGRLSIHPVTLLAFLTVVGLAGPATPMRADTIILSNVVGNCCGGDQVSGPGVLGGSESLAEAFVPPSNVQLSNVEVEVFPTLGFGGDPYFDLSLFSNASGIPGSLLDTLGSDLKAPSGGGLVTVLGSVPLNAGQEYWIVLTPFDSTSDVGWEQGGSENLPFAATTSVTGTSGWISAGSPQPLQLQVDASSVPEPGSFTLAFSGMAGLTLLLTRRMA